MRYNQDLFCICGGTVGIDGKTQSHGILCPHCRSAKFDVQTFEDIFGRSPADPAWYQRLVVAYHCTACNYQWNYREGCPGNAACESGNLPHNKLTDVVPRDSSQYAVIVEL